MEYSGGLAQHTCLAIAAAADDVNAVFSVNVNAPIQSSAGASGSAPGATADSVTALVSQWAHNEARQCASLLRRHALSPFAASAYAPGALLCCNLALAFFAALELSHGLSLQEVVLQELWLSLSGEISGWGCGGRMCAGPRGGRGVRACDHW